MARSGASRGHGRLQGVRVPDRGDHLVPRIAQQQHQPLPEEGRVLPDHDPHGSSTSRRVPSPGRLSSSMWPPWAAIRSASPASPPAGSGHGAAAPVVLDAHDEAAVVPGAP